MKTIKILLTISTIFISICSSAQKYGYVNEQSEFIIEPKFNEAREFKDGIAAVNFTDKKGWTRWYFIDENGAFINQMKYWSVNDFNESFTTVEYGIGYWGIIDKTEKNIASLTCDFMSIVQDGMIMYRKKGKIGFFNTNGDKVVKPIYDNARLFSNGFACVELNGKFGFINKNGEIVVPIKYIKTKDFVNNKSKVVLGYGYFEVDSSGKEVKISKGEFDKNEVSLIPEIPKKVSKFRVQKKLQQTQNAANSNQTNSNISVSSFALDLFSELGSMALYDGSTMYVVKVKGKTMQDQGSVAARATQVLGFSKALKYQWFAGNNCTTLTSKYSSVFTVICQGEIDLNK